MMIRFFANVWWCMLTAALTVALFHAVAEIDKRVDANLAATACDAHAMRAAMTATGWSCIDEEGREWR